MKKFGKVSVLFLVVLMLGYYVSVRAQTPPLINVTKIAHPIAMPPGIGTVTYDYTVLNMGIVAMSNVTLVDDSCSSLNFISGDANGNSRLDTTETWKYRCITTISQTTTSKVVATGEAEGLTAVDTANATVFVGVPLPPPLVHLAITPNLFVLPTAGGAVTYTYTITNPSPTSLSNVIVTDDRCIGLPGQVSGYSGDINQNNILESSETWTFNCQTNLTQTATNIATAQGSGSGLTATDSSSVTVVVSAPGLPVTGSVPGLPNTGLSPNEKSPQWNIFIPAGIFVALFAILISRKKKII